MKTIKLKVKLKCASCAINIEKVLAKYNIKLIINPTLNIVKLTYNPQQYSLAELIQKIEGIGYEIKQTTT